MKGSQIRQKFLDYFERNGHKVVHSSPLLPANDPTLLFTNAGMNQFKDVFTGVEKRDYKRAVSSQKCIRAGGKHNDLDEVGKTARHHTFFEMLGNFSFGDYFKEDAIRFAWDFLVNELKLEEKRLWFSVFEGDADVPADDEARALWEKAGAKPERVLGFGRKDNFWQMGDTGPCGPCSEIHYYMGDEPDNPEANHPKWVNGEGDTTMEIWNLVFMQFNIIGHGKKVLREKDDYYVRFGKKVKAEKKDWFYPEYELKKLPAPSVDTGAGLERVAAVMQGVKTNYDTDLIRPIINYSLGLSVIGSIKSQGTVELGVLATLAKKFEIPLESIVDEVILNKIEITDTSAQSTPLEGNAVSIPCFRVSMGTPHRIDISTGEAIAAPDFISASEFKKKLGIALEKNEVVVREFYHQQLFASRVIADHARSTAFAIADGILPGNEGRNYVLRKIMRRAIYNGREHLGFDGPFFYKVCDFVVDQMKDAFPELEIQRDFIGKMVRLEEERFGATMTVGLQRLQELLDKSDYDMPEHDEFSAMQVPGFVDLIDLAKLYDTYGMPIDLMYVVLRGKAPSVPDHEPGGRPTFWKLRRNLGTQFEPVWETFSVVETCGYVDWDDEIGMTVEDYAIPLIDEERFRSLIDEELKKLQEHSAIGKTRQPESTKPVYVALSRQSDMRTVFRGYDGVQFEGVSVLALIKDDERVDSLNLGDEGFILLNETPFYSEAGGQVGDTGTLLGTTLVANVLDTFSPVLGVTLHKSKIEKGSIKVGDVVTASVDVAKRDAVRRNHTATHLVHAALKEVLGTHVKQAGSVVAPNYLRFDFTHYQPISETELQEIEDLVNREILKNDPVNTDLMSIEEAMRTGAMALFGEKYGSTVRVLSVGGGEFSKELCGGTHVRATGDIGSFKIMADEAVASGVRRIRAITGTDAFARFREDEKLIADSLGVLKTQRDNLPAAIEKLQEELKKTRKEMDELKMKIATGAIGGGSSDGDEAKVVAGVSVIAKIVEGLDKGGMRQLSDTLMSRQKSGVVILARTEEDKVSFIVRVSDDLTGKVKAGEIVKNIAPIVGGRGGGKADMAEGGGTDASKLPEALEASYGVIESMIG